MRARIRTIDELPHGFFCCAEALARVERFGGLIVDLRGAPVAGRSLCFDCGHHGVYDELHYAVTGQAFDYVPLSCIDIDEGEVALAFVGTNRSNKKEEEQ